METKLGKVKCPAILKKVGSVVTKHDVLVDIYDLHDGGFKTACPQHPFYFRAGMKNTMEIT